MHKAKAEMGQSGEVLYRVNEKVEKLVAGWREREEIASFNGASSRALRH